MSAITIYATATVMTPKLTRSPLFCAAGGGHVALRAAGCSERTARRRPALLGKNAVFHLKNLTSLSVYQQSVRIIANPFEACRRHFQRKEPVVSEHILRGPVPARQNLAEGPVMGGPTGRTMIGTDSEAACRLEIMLVSMAIQCRGPGIPTMRLRDPLIAARSRVGLSSPVLRRPIVLAWSSTLVRRLGYRHPANHGDGEY